MSVLYTKSKADLYIRRNKSSNLQILFGEILDEYNSINNDVYRQWRFTNPFERRENSIRHRRYRPTNRTNYLWRDYLCVRFIFSSFDFSSTKTNASGGIRGEVSALAAHVLRSDVPSRFTFFFSFLCLSFKYYLLLGWNVRFPVSTVDTAVRNKLFTIGNA